VTTYSSRGPTRSRYTDAQNVKRQHEQSARSGCARQTGGGGGVTNQLLASNPSLLVRDTGSENPFNDAERHFDGSAGGGRNSCDALLEANPPHAEHGQIIFTVRRNRLPDQLSGARRKRALNASRRSGASKQKLIRRDLTNTNSAQQTNADNKHAAAAFFFRQWEEQTFGESGRDRTKLCDHGTADC